MSHSDICFLLDEHVPTALLNGLKGRSIDATSVDELSLKGTDDPDVLALAAKLGRVLVTLDSDFLRVPPPLSPHAGIVFIRPKMTIGAVLDALTLIHGTCTCDEMRNRVEHCSHLG